MRTLEKIASCQISFLPVLTDNYIEDINKVIEIIRSFRLEHEIGIMSTVVRGEKAILLQMITEIYNTMNNRCSFVMDVKISNLCGC